MKISNEGDKISNQNSLTKMIHLYVINDTEEKELSKKRKHGVTVRTEQMKLYFIEKLSH